MSEKRSICVQIFGQEYHLRSDGDEAAMQRAAALVDEKMHLVNQRTKTADTLNIAVLAGLNIANLLLAERAQRASEEVNPAESSVGDPLDVERLRSLIELVESSVDWADSIPSR